MSASGKTQETIVGKSGGQAVPVTGAQPTTGTMTSVTVTTAVVTVLASNAARLGAIITHEFGPTVFVALAAASASATAYSVRLQPGGVLEVPFQWTGRISAVTVIGTATLRVTEFS